MLSGSLLRFSLFAAIFASLAVWERIAARRTLQTGRSRRWWSNLGLGALGALTIKLLAVLLPVGAAYGAAAVAAARGWGLCRWAGMPYTVNVLTTLVVFDLAIYIQHVVFHKIPVLWRMHRVHHSDLDLDVSSALRFHPAEILISMLLKTGLALLMGAAPLGVLLFEIILNGMAMFNHANIAIPPRVDQWLRMLAVTPDMHRIHHSVQREETDSNFGFNLSWWDRIFRTYRAQPSAGHAGMALGLDAYRDPAKLGLAWLLGLPLSPLEEGDVQEKFPGRD